MFSTTIKRSVATLGVVAGLLAAAVPASAAPVLGDHLNATTAVKAPKPSDTDRSLITNGSADGYFDFEWEAEQIIMRDGGICDPIRHMGC